GGKGKRTGGGRIPRGARFACGFVTTLCATRPLPTRNVGRMYKPCGSRSRTSVRLFCDTESRQQTVLPNCDPLRSQISSSPGKSAIPHGYPPHFPVIKPAPSPRGTDCLAAESWGGS